MPTIGRPALRPLAALACLALAAGPVAALAAEPLGRLFLSPEERRLIDVHPERTDGAATGNAATKNDSDLVTINGLVTRSSGKRTVWLNRTPLSEGESAPVGRPVAIPKPPAVDVALPGQSGTQRIKPGQSYDPGSGSVTESFNKTPTPLAPPPEAGKTPVPATPGAPNPADYLPKLPGLPPIPR